MERGERDMVLFHGSYHASGRSEYPNECSERLGTIGKKGGRMALTGKEKKEDKTDTEKPVIARTAYDLQRLKLEKLMKNVVCNLNLFSDVYYNLNVIHVWKEKPAPIPEGPKEKNMPHVPDFVRNVMGSSAGAGSGEFHVYRHLRRKEYARQKFIQEKGEKELLEEAYHLKIEENRKAAEERTAKKRAKRLKKKGNKGKKQKKDSTISDTIDEPPSDSESEADDNGAEN
ncbi:PRKR-interacting protein 1-like protein [Cryptotermes secundus]|uniref:PRKR-interacting protein 1-like protein n=1 Tax=Cryptotermes secundus TaxID=105785 RepID=A0A2J7RJ60_9NEOP|nr:PRKR-interacting protein 1 homolog isoform X1 [Cryptotermes secundus]PNF40869.1 PRKR-interacting protein 1-like protein [Cryptotermes secundus]